MCSTGPAPGAAARCRPACCRPRQGCTRQGCPQGLQEVSSPRGSSAAAAAGPPAPAAAAAAMRQQQRGGWGRCGRSSVGWGGAPSHLALCQVALWSIRQAHVFPRCGLYQGSERASVACCRALGLCRSPYHANAVDSYVVPVLIEALMLCSSDDMVTWAVHCSWRLCWWPSGEEMVQVEIVSFSNKQSAGAVGAVVEVVNGQFVAAAGGHLMPLT